jgi:hypothetical protein
VWEYKAEISSRTGDNTVEYRDERLWQDSSTEYNNNLMAQDFEIGNAIAARFDISVYPRFDIEKMDEVRFFRRLDGREWVQSGVFYVFDWQADTNKNSMRLECYDWLRWSDTKFLVDGYDPVYPMTMRAAVESLGIPIDPRTDFENYMLTYQNDRTIREVLQDIASAHGGNFTITAKGELRLVPAYEQAIAYDIGRAADDYTQQKPSTVTGLVFRWNDGTEFWGEGSEQTGAVIDLHNDTATQMVADDAFRKLGGTYYTPYQAPKAVITPAFELGDGVRIAGNYHVINACRVFYSGGNIRTSLSSPFSPQSQATAQSRQRGGGEAAPFPEISYDYNETHLEIAERETTIASIDVEVSRSGSAHGGLQLTFWADDDSEAFIRVYDNEAQQLYSPIRKQFQRGYNQVGIPNTYKLLRSGRHFFEATMQSRLPLNIATRAVDYFVNLVSHDIPPIGYDIYDVTISQPVDALEPIYVYAIAKHEDGYPIVIRARYVYGRSYSGADFTTVWAFPHIPTFDGAAIEFSGIYKIIGKWLALETQEKPWIFWIEDATLYAQRGDDEYTRTWISDEVLSVSACQGWNSRQVEANDMGLVVAYVKYNGIIAYKTRKGIVTASEIWNAEEYLEYVDENNNTVQVTGSTVQVNRLNDWRLVFFVDGTAYITGRNYIGDTATENVGLDIGVAGEIGRFFTLTVSPAGWDTSYTADFDDGLDYVDFNFNNRPILRAHASRCFTVSGGVTITGSHVDGNTLRLIFGEKPAKGSTITFTPLQDRVVLELESGTLAALAAPMSVLFTVPVHHDQPAETVELNIGANSFSLDVLPLRDLDGYANETAELHIGINSFNLQVTPLGYLDGYAPDETVEVEIGITNFTLNVTFTGVIPI